MQSLNYLLFRIRRKSLFILWNLQCLISPDKIANFTLIDGSRFDYPLKSLIGCALFIKSFELAEIEFMRNSLKTGDTFIDIGANGGIFTIIAAKQVQNHGHVYAFEPDRRNLEILRHNIAINNLTNITVLESAVSNTKGTTKFAIAEDGAMNSLANTSRPEQQIKEWQVVPVTTLDDFVGEYKVENINFVKIDTEGAEKLIFAGAKQIFARDRQVIVLFEASDLNASGFNYVIKDFLLSLINSGLKLYYLDRLGNPLLASDYRSDFGNLIYNFVVSNQSIS